MRTEEDLDRPTTGDCLRMAAVILCIVLAAVGLAVLAAAFVLLAGI